MMRLRADSTAVVMPGIEAESLLSTTALLTSPGCSRRDVAVVSAGVELQGAPVFLGSGYVAPAHARLHLLDQAGPQKNRRPVCLGEGKVREARASFLGQVVETEAFRQPAGAQTERRTDRKSVV